MILHLQTYNNKFRIKYDIKYRYLELNFANAGISQSKKNVNKTKNIKSRFLTKSGLGNCQWSTG